MLSAGPLRSLGVFPGPPLKTFHKRSQCFLLRPTRVIPLFEESGMKVCPRMLGKPPGFIPQNWDRTFFRQGVGPKRQPPSRRTKTTSVETGILRASKPTGPFHPGSLVTGHLVQVKKQISCQCRNDSRPQASDAGKNSHVFNRGLRKLGISIGIKCLL